MMMTMVMKSKTEKTKTMKTDMKMLLRLRRTTIIKIHSRKMMKSDKTF